jgi:hypothetical protein
VTLKLVPEPLVAVTWSLVGGPCAGEYSAESAWPPPDRIRAVHGGGLLGDGAPAVLNLPCDEREPGETIVEYVLRSHGFACRRGRGTRSPWHALYVPAEFTDREVVRALLVSAGINPELASVDGGG